jgi:hypothetical protein
LYGLQALERIFGLVNAVFQSGLGTRKNKIPSTKRQIPNKFQAPNANDPNEGTEVIVIVVVMVKAINKLH